MSAPTISQLRDDIDRGRTRDKHAYPDPAAVPLGTDDEAGGTPDAAASISLALCTETGRGTDCPTNGRLAVAVYTLIVLAIGFATMAGVVAMATRPG
jgi:hypothetical protein